MDQGYDLPKDDRDARLARALAEGTRVDSEDEALLQAVSTHRSEYERTGGHSEERSQRVWSGIAQQLYPEASTPRERAPIRRLSTSVSWPHRVAWAVAASLALLFVVLSVLRPSSPEMIAQSDGAQLVHTVADGSVVTLRSHSTLWRIGRDRYRIEGEGYFDVTHDPTRTFAVEAGEGTIEVLGTRFDVRTWGGETAVYLSEGRVRFSGRGGEPVVLQPGESSRLGESGHPLMPVLTDEALETDWLQGALYFDVLELSDVVAELAHHFGVQLEIPSDLAEETLSGRILLRSRGQALDDLGLVLGGRFELSGEDRYEWVAD